MNSSKAAMCVSSSQTTQTRHWISSAMFTHLHLYQTFVPPKILKLLKNIVLLLITNKHKCIDSLFVFLQM